MPFLTIINRRRLALLVTSAVLVAVAGLGAIGGVNASSTVRAAPPAYANMAALRSPATGALALPSVVANIPDGLGPSAGALHHLLPTSGINKIAVYAWIGSNNRVCVQSTHGGGGCFDNFDEPISPTISDADRIGAGLPVFTWGAVSDDVVAVHVRVAGRLFPAVVKNNVFFYELTDPTATPDAVTGYVIRMRGGGEVTLDA